MNIKLYKLTVESKKKLANAWYWLMKPLAYFYTTEKINKRYEKKRSKITEEQAIRWIAEDIGRFVIRHKTEIDILICDYASEDDFWNGCILKYSCPYYIKRDKTRMAFYKFEKDIVFQEKIIEHIKTLNGIKVVEVVEDYTWQRIDNYKKTVTISSS